MNFSVSEFVETVEQLRELAIIIGVQENHYEKSSALGLSLLLNTDLEANNAFWVLEEKILKLKILLKNKKMSNDCHTITS